MSFVSRLARSLSIAAYPLVKPVLPRGYRPYRYDGGRIYLNLHESHMMFQRALNLYEQDKKRAIRGMLKPGMTYVDIGVNKGYFTLIAAREVGPAGRVISIEPEAENCRWIRQSIEANGYQNVTLFEAAAGDHEGEVELFIGHKSGHHSLVRNERKHAGATVAVPMHTLDNVLAERGIETIDAVKIDVEGAEMGVLRGAEDTLRRSEGVTVLMDLHPHMGVDVHEVAAFLRGLGFTLYEMAHPDRQLRNIPPDLTEIVARR